MRIGVRLGARELLGATPTWSDIRSRLQPYSLRAIFDALARLSILIDDSDAYDERAQRSACVAFFGDEGHDIWERARRWTDEEGRRPLHVAVFDQFLVLNAAKAALLSARPDREDSSYPPRLLGEALLMLSSFMTGMLEERPSDQDLFRRHLEYFEYVAGFLYSREVPLHAFARSWDLYLSGNPTLVGSRHWLDLRGVIQCETGMSPEDAFSAMMIFVAPWVGTTVESLPVAHTVFGRAYFDRMRLEGAEELSRIFGTLVQPVSSACAAIRREYSPEHLRPYHTLPLARAPLLDLDGVVVCTSTKLLTERLQRGWHHILLSAFPRGSSEAKRFLDFMGDVFEDYVDRLFRRIYPTSPVLANRYLGAREIEAALRDAKCDAILDDGDTLILFECKARRFPLEAISGESRTSYEKTWMDTYVTGAARQLSSTIAAVRRGSLRSLGLEPHRIRRYIPVVCTLDVTPLGPHQHHRLWNESRARGFFTGQEQDVASMQAITIAELEMLELHVHLGGGSIGEVFRTKVDDHDLRQNPVRTTTFRIGSPVHSREKSPYLAHIFDGLATRLQSFLERRVTMSANGRHDVSSW